MNKGLKIALIVSAILLSLGIFYSIKGPLDFNDERDERYIAIIAQLQDIAKLQKEYHNQTGKYTKGMDTLISFADTASFVIRERIDTTYYKVNAQGINIPYNEVIFRELGKVKVKDSIFKKRDFKNLGIMSVGAKKPFTTEINVKYNVNADSTDFTTDYFFKTYATKQDILEGLNENFVTNEISEAKTIIDDEIYVGSLSRQSTEGNWSPELDYLANEWNLKQNSDSEEK